MISISNVLVKGRSCSRFISGNSFWYKMNWKTWSILLVALLVGLAASYVIKGIFFVDRDVAQNPDETEFCVKEQLLVANGDLPAGTELSAL